MNLFYQPGIRDGHLFLTPEESRHCARVLRKKAGDTLTITDGKGVFYDAQLTVCTDRHCEFIIQHERPEEAKKHSIHLAISPTKSPDRTEWCVEKAVEIGVDKFTFLQCERTERPTVNTNRIERVAVSAMKQSWRASLPAIEPLTPFPEFIRGAGEDEKFIAHAHPEHPPNLLHTATPRHSYCILVGPEGDFSEAEIEMSRHAGFAIVSLGDHRLRTESAGLVAVHILNLLNL